MPKPSSCKLLMREFETHDVQRFVFSKPEGFSYQPGQGVDMALDQDGWREEWRPFTPTSLNSDAVLQFIIKGYPSHDGVTRRLHRLSPGDRVLLKQAFGTIQYHGPGIFIAGGAGITPFLSIIRDLAQRAETHGQTLVFANKTLRDIICQRELEAFFGERCFFALSQEERPGFLHGRLDRAQLEACIDDLSRHFYICGPQGFIAGARDILDGLGVDEARIVVEEA
jgi:cytochrome-b5 reductase